MFVFLFAINTDFRICRLLFITPSARFLQKRKDVFFFQFSYRNKNVKNQKSQTPLIK